MEEFRLELQKELEKEISNCEVKLIICEDNIC